LCLQTGRRSRLLPAMLHRWFRERGTHGKPDIFDLLAMLKISSGSLTPTWQQEACAGFKQ